jgi:hypothetical protein
MILVLERIASANMLGVWSCACDPLLQVFRLPLFVSGVGHRIAPGRVLPQVSVSAST